MKKFNMHDFMRIWHKTLRWLSTLFLVYWIYETITEGWADNGHWLIAWAIVLAIHTSCEIYFTKEVELYSPKKSDPKTRVKFSKRCKAAILAFRYPNSQGVMFRETLLAIDHKVPVLKKEFKIQEPHVRAWFQCDSSDGPSEEVKARIKEDAMRDLVKSLEPYLLVDEYTDVHDFIYRLLISLRVVDPNG